MIKQLGTILSKRQKCQLSRYVFLLMVGALLDTAAAALMFPLMNAIVNKDYTIWHFSFSEERVAYLAMAMGAVYVIRGIYRYFINKGLYTFKSSAQIQMTDRLFRGYVNQPYLYHLHKSGAEITQSVTQDVSYTYTAVLCVLHIISEGLVALFLLVFLLLINPLLTLMAAVLIVSILLLVNRLIAKTIDNTGRITREKFVHMLRGIQQGLGGIKSIKANRRENVFAAQYAQQYKDFSLANRKYAIISQMPQLAVETISMAGCFTLVAVLLWSGTGIESLLPALATFALAAVRLMPAANRINSDVTRLKFSKTYVQATYNALQETQEKWEEGVAQGSSGKDAVAPLTYGVEAKGISFQYPEQQSPLFTDLNLYIPAGKSVALTGPTGVGKTTLADLFLGLLRPFQGTISADGRDIAKEPFWWAKRVGYVPQQIFLTESSVRENVAFGFNTEKIDDDFIWECLHKANIDEFVKSLPQGLETQVGERGMRLSGGQQQRLGIARALYTRPQFLVLDEATSALDSDTEQVVMDALCRLSGKITMLVIAHRQTTVDRCDISFAIPK